jgi:hypothetical protein
MRRDPVMRETRFRFDPSTYDARRAEVAAMIDEGDRQDDHPMGPDGLADALMEIAEGWSTEAWNAALQAVEEAVGGLDRFRGGYDGDYLDENGQFVEHADLLSRIAALRKGA